MVTLVVGGARSGKSTFAESLFQDKRDVVYIATARVEDEEMSQRVIQHRAFRPNYWRTFEGTYNIEDAIGSEKHYLLDCITVLTSNIMFDISKGLIDIDSRMQQSIEDEVIHVIEKLVNKSKNMCLDLVMVTNEVGCSIVPENQIARAYRDIIGRVNQKVAKMSDEAFAIVCGIPMKLK